MCRHHHRLKGYQRYRGVCSFAIRDAGTPEKCPAALPLGTQQHQRKLASIRFQAVRPFTLVNDSYEIWIVRPRARLRAGARFVSASPQR